MVVCEYLDTLNYINSIGLQIIKFELAGINNRNVHVTCEWNDKLWILFTKNTSLQHVNCLQIKSWHFAKLEFGKGYINCLRLVEYLSKSQVGILIKVKV